MWAFCTLWCIFVYAKKTWMSYFLWRLYCRSSRKQKQTNRHKKLNEKKHLNVDVPSKTQNPNNFFEPIFNDKTLNNSKTKNECTPTNAVTPSCFMCSSSLCSHTQRQAASKAPYNVTSRPVLRVRGFGGVFEVSSFHDDRYGRQTKQTVSKSAEVG